jgi:hypothetical protein
MTEHKELVDRLRDLGGPAAWKGRAERENACEGCCGPHGKSKPKDYKNDLDFAAMRESARVIEEQAAEIARLKKVIEVYREAQADQPPHDPLVKWAIDRFAESRIKGPTPPETGS